MNYHTLEISLVLISVSVVAVAACYCANILVGFGGQPCPKSAPQGERILPQGGSGTAPPQSPKPLTNSG